jgi:C-terminal processing protease CtpA/Prc
VPNATTWRQDGHLRHLGGGRGAVLTAFLACIALLAAGCAATWGGSIGAVLTRNNETGKVTVREAPEGKGAAKAGLVPGDELIAIEGHEVRNLSAEQVHAALEGPVGSKVKLTVQSETSAPHDVKVERSPLDHP